MTMEQDMEYYRRYLKGDADALGELMKLYRERLIFFAMEFLSSPDDAEEVAAECFAELALHPLRYRFGSSVKTYLFAIARNKALTLCRKQTRPVSYTHLFWNGSTFLSMLRKPFGKGIGNCHPLKKRIWINTEMTASVK